MATVDDIFSRFVQPTSNTPTLAQEVSNQISAEGIEGFVRSTTPEIRRLDDYDPRSLGSKLEDAGLSAANAYSTGILGIGAAATSIFNRKLGAKLALDVNNLNQNIQSNQSDYLNNQRRIVAERNAYKFEANAEQYSKDIKTDGTILATAKKIGRDSIDSFVSAFQNPSTASDIIASGVGSLFTGAPIASSLRSLGASTVGRVATGATAKRIGNAVAMPAAIGILEGSSAFTGTVGEAYERLKSRTDLTEDQKLELAAEAGQISGAIQTPIAGLVSTFANKIDRNPLKLQDRPFRESLKEAGEEAIQSATGALSQNVGIQNKIDPDQSLTEGIGEGIAQGVIGGAGSAMAVQTPGTALRTVTEGTNATVKGIKNVGKAALPIFDYLTSRGQKIINQNQASDTNQEDIIEAATFANEDAPYIQDRALVEIDELQLTDTQKEDAEVYSFKLSNLFNIHPNEENVTETDNRIEAITSLINQPNLTDEQKLLVKNQVDKLIAPIKNIFQYDPEFISQLKQDSEAFKDIVNLLTLASNFETSKELSDFNSDIDSIVESKIDSYSNLTDDQFTDPSLVQEVITSFVVNPERANPEVISKILFQNDNGNITLTPEQRTKLEAVSSMVQAKRDYDAKSEELGLSPQQIVSSEIEKRNDEPGKRSIKQYVDDILSANDEGDTELVKHLLNRFLNFAQHMQNKVDALNSHFENGGKTVKYQALSPKGIWYESPTGLGVTKTSPNSIQFAQRVALDAEAVITVANRLNQFFSELGLKDIKSNPLASELMSQANEVVEALNPKPEPEVVIEEESSSNINTVDSILEQAVEAPVEPVQEEVQEEVTVEPEVTNVTEEAPETNTEVTTSITEEVTEPVNAMDILYPNLTGGKDNKFKEAYKLPEEPMNRLVGLDNVVGDFLNAIKSVISLNTFIGKEDKLYTSSIADTYSKAVKSIGNIKRVLDRRLQSAIENRGGSIDDPNFLKYSRNKVFHITDNVNGKIAYNSNLIGSALLAALDFRINFNNYVNEKDAEDIAGLLGISEYTETDNQIQKMSEGLTTNELIRTLRNKIKSYWGVRDNDDVPIGYTDGIAESVAAEIVQSMIETGDIIENDPVIFTSRNGIKGTRTFNIYSVKPIDNKDINKYRDFIEKTVLIEPDVVSYINEIPTKISKNQIRNNLSNITSDQITALENEQKVPFYFNKAVSAVYNSIGIETLLNIFASGNISEKAFENNYNQKHAESLKGKNQSIISAFKAYQELAEQLEHYSEMNNTDISNIPVYYRYAFSVVNRMQMLGKQNPQASKLMREIMLPTKSTIDLTDPELNKMYHLALAQALKIKVHKQPIETSVKEVKNLLATTFKPVIDDLNLVLNSTGEISEYSIDLLKNHGISFFGLHALTDYAQYLNTTDLSSYTTSMYMEADGVTNGPVNAMNMMTPGYFTEDQIINLEKGGLFLDSIITKMNDFKGTDLYQTTSNSLSGFLNQLQKYLQSDEKENLISVLNVLSEVFKGDIIVDGSHIVIGRSISKNPLTITIYGSGSMGIAGNISEEIAQYIYSKMTAVIQADPETPTHEIWFPNDPLSKDKFDKFNNDFKKIIDINFGDIRTFEFSSEDMLHMTNLINEVFVKPLRNSISITVSHELMDVIDKLQRVTQIQSLYYRYHYNKEVKALMDQKKKEGRLTDEYLSKKELRSIHRKLKSILPLVSNGKQNWILTKFASLPTKEAKLGADLTGGMSTAGEVSVPTEAGVSAIPYLTIGYGDGRMMQILSHTLLSNLKVFDGINLPIDQINSGSLKANEAVFETWMNNPILDVFNMFNNFIQNVNLNDVDTETKKLIQSAIGANYGYSLNNINSLREDFGLLAKDIEARHRVLKDTNLYVDQMASAGQSYNNQGSLVLDEMTYAEKVDVLNKAYDKKRKTNIAIQDDIESDLLNVGRKHKSGTRELSFTAIRNLVRNANIPSDQLAIYTDILRSLKTKNYKIVYGTNEQLKDYAIQNELADLYNNIKPNNKGFILVEQNLIVIANPSSETLLHELIHAATFNKINDYYEGNKVEPEVEGAIQRIEVLMDQFVNLDLDGTNLRYKVVKQQILKNLAIGNKAVALNEYMAWSLSNRNLIEIQKNTKADKLATIAKQAIDTFKKLIFGRKWVSKPAEDMFTNLQFNTNIILRSQPSITESFNETVLYQSDTYGNSNRLTKINEILRDKIVRFMDTTYKDKIDKKTKIFHAVKTSIEQLASQISEELPMTEQEMTTFRAIAMALATEVELNPSSLLAIQDVYAQAIKNKKVTDFMPSLIHIFSIKLDQGNRSSLVPSFLALAVVNEEFREILSTIPVEKYKKLPNNSMDNIIDNITNSLMDSLSSKVSGQSNAKNLKEAIDNLTETIVEVAQDRKLFIERFTEPVGNVIDTVNDKITDLLVKAGDKIYQSSDYIEKNSKSSVLRNIAVWTKFISGITSETNGNAVAEWTLDNLNQSNSMRFFKELLTDIIGRVDSNADVYDLIKKVRALVSQTRQQYRENVPSIISSKFKNPLSKDNWTSLFNSIASTDLISLRTSFSVDEIINLLSEPNRIDNLITDIEQRIRNLDKSSNLIFNKSKQLATYMVTGSPGNNLLRNAYAISMLLGHGSTNRTHNQQLENNIDQLVTLYAFQMIKESDRSYLANIAKNEKEGLSFLLNYMYGLRANEKTKAYGYARINGYKGAMPFEAQTGVSLVVGNIDNASNLIERSYKLVGNYEGSNLVRSKSTKGYYYSPVSGSNPFNQGIVQNVRPTSFGVDLINGFTHGPSVIGRITNETTVKAIFANRSREKGKEPLLPIYDTDGNIFAYEMSIDPSQLEKLNRNTQLHELIGIARGRQIEEAMAQQVNDTLIDSLYNMYQNDLKDSSYSKDQYVNVLDPKELDKDPVLRDAVSLLSKYTLESISSRFGQDAFYIRRDMLNDVLGYRKASVGDFWTGNNRLSPEFNKRMKALFMSAFGNDAYRYMLNAETVVRNVVTDAKVLVVIKSVIVSAINFITNLYQLISRGVPILDIARNMPKKLVEIESYTKLRIRQIELEADLLAAKDKIIVVNRIKSELKSIDDAYKRMSIWPLIQAGEFTAISDASISNEEIMLTDGRLTEYIERQVDKLPKGVRDAGRYAVISKDTSLFRALQKSVQYGDFLAKAVLYDYLTKKKGLTKKEALARITEEFVNYDKLPGRTRGYLEEIGLLWFWNFKVRSMKIALGIIRNNPVHALFAASIPQLDMFGDVGSPVEDNLASVFGDGRLGYSVGPEQALRSLSLNPWYNLTN